MPSVKAPTMLLSVENLSVRSGTTQILRNVNLRLDQGDRVGLIGESGSGKSLTSLSIFGLLPDNLEATGSIRLAGADHEIIGARDRDMMRLRGSTMGMVFQEPMTALNPTMKIGRQVAEVLQAHRAVDRREALNQARLLIERVRLPDPDRVMSAYPHQLSGGQRQRVVLAIAIANKPRLLLCDEPTTALDVTVQAHMLDLISSVLDESDAALLFVTHDLAVVATVCDRVVVMFGGEVLEAGPVSTVFTEPRHPYTRGLLAASNLQDVDENGRLRTITPELFAYRELMDRCRYCAGGQDQDGGRQARWIETEEGGYSCWHEHSSTSDDVRSAAVVA